MINSFIISFKLKNTYRVNSIIYSIKHTPFIKKLFSYSLYKNKIIKFIANIISIITELLSIFLGKLLYFILFYYLIINSFENQSLAFINVFVFLTIIGGFINTYLFNPSIDKYYAIFLLKFDSKEYTLSNYIYLLIKCLIGFLPFTIIFAIYYKIPLWISFLMPIFAVCIKNIFNYMSLTSYEKHEKIKNENKFVPIVIISAVILLALAYGMPYFGIGIDYKIFSIISIFAFIFGLISFIKLLKSNVYTKMCKDILKKDEIIPDKSNSEIKMYKNQITNTEIANTNKTGYAYFNFVFTRRHMKLLTNATKNISIGLIAFFVIVICITIFFPSKNQEVNDLLKNSIPYYMFVMYFINRGQRICQTMFMNCDRSMLTYRFYREKDAILLLFKERLKTLIKLNVIPGFLIAVGTSILLFTTGGTSLMIYIITFITIISMSIFFSVHYLVLYYLLQPYDVNLDIKNPLFMSICGLTYFICYMASQVQIPTIIFGICMCSFTIIYSLLSLFLAYKYAPARFKLRV